MTIVFMFCLSAFAIAATIMNAMTLNAFRPIPIPDISGISTSTTSKGDE